MRHNNQQAPPTLCEEFVQRFYQLQQDGKDLWKALSIAGDEFAFKIIQQSKDCFFFTDGTGCEYMFGDWHITKS